MTEEQLKRIFARNLTRLLESRNYTQESFIDAFNKRYGTQFTRVSVSTWINHKKMPRPIIVQQIGEFFGHDAGYMLTDHRAVPPLNPRSTNNSKSSLNTLSLADQPNPTPRDPEMENLVRRIRALPKEKLASLKAFLDVLENA